MLEGDEDQDQFRRGLLFVKDELSIIERILAGCSSPGI